MDIIDTLKNEGVLKLWHHYKRHAKDLSGNGNDGTYVGDASLTGSSVKMGGVTSHILIGDNSSVRITDATFYGYSPGGIIPGPTFSDIFAKRNGGTDYECYLDNAGRMGVSDGSLHTSTTTATGVKGIALSVASGASGRVYHEGVFVETLPGGAITFPQSAASLSLLNLSTSSNQYSRTAWSDLLLFSRVLTDPEQILLNAKIISLQHYFDSRPYEIASGTKFVQRKGIYESVATVGVGEIIENSGFRNTGTATTSKIVHTAVKGVLCPVIECVANGVLSIPTSRFHQTPTEAAYGTWEFSLLKTGAGAAPLVAFINGLSNRVIGGGVNDGYILAMSGSETIACSRIDNGSVTNKFTTVTGFVNVGQRYHFKITRSVADVFTFYMDGEIVDVTGGSGTNPFTDATITTSNYIAPDLDTGGQFGGLVKDIV